MSELPEGVVERAADIMNICGDLEVTQDKVASNVLLAALDDPEFRRHVLDRCVSEGELVCRGWIVGDDYETQFAPYLFDSGFDPALAVQVFTIADTEQRSGE